MTARAALLAHAQGAERQRYVVGHHQQVFYRDLLLLHPVADRLARQIHVGGGLEQNDGAPLVAQRGDRSVTVGLKRDVGCLCQGIQHSESYVVTGIGIFGADVTQSGNEVFHSNTVLRHYC